VSALSADAPGGAEILEGSQSSHAVQMNWLPFQSGNGLEIRDIGRRRKNPCAAMGDAGSAAIASLGAMLLVGIMGDVRGDDVVGRPLARW
jgi:hypothetical protein